MKITMNIDDEEIRERVTQIVSSQLAKDLFDRYTSERRLLADVMNKVVKDVLLSEKDKIVDRAVEAAARKLAYGNAPKVIQKLAKEAGRDDQPTD